MMTDSSLLIALLAHALLSLSLTTPTGRWAASRVCTHDRGRRGRRQAAAILRVCVCASACVGERARIRFHPATLAKFTAHTDTQTCCCTSPRTADWRLAAWSTPWSFARCTPGVVGWGRVTLTVPLLPCCRSRNSFSVPLHNLSSLLSTNLRVGNKTILVKYTEKTQF